MGLSWRDITPDWAEGAVSTVGRELYKATPLDNVVGVAQGIREGDWGKVARNVAGGAFDIGMMAIPAGQAFRASRLGGSGVARAGFSGLARGLVKDPTATIAGRGLARVAPNFAASRLGRSLVFGTGLVTPGSAAERAAWGSIGKALGSPALAATTMPMAGAAAGRSSAPQRPAGLFGTADTMERKLQQQAGATTTPTTGTAGAGAGTGAGTGGAGTAGGGAAASVPAGGLAAMDPAMQAALNAERIAAEQEFQDYINQLSLARVRGSVEEEAALRAAARASTGGAIDVAGAFGEAGLGYSPATLQSALEQLRADEAVARRGVLSGRTARQSEAARAQTAAQRAYENALQSIRAREIGGRVGQTISMIQPYLGGA